MLIENTTEPGQLLKDDVFSALLAAPAPPLKPEPEERQPKQALQASEPVKEVSANLSAVTTPAQAKSQMQACVVKEEKHRQATLSSAEPSCLSSSANPSRAFEDLTFAEVRDLARMQFKGFDRLNADEIEKLAKQKYFEAMVCINHKDASSSHLNR